MATIAPPRVPVDPLAQRGGGPGGGQPPSEGWGDDGAHSSGPTARTYRIGMWVALGGITMIFAGLSSAYVVRQGLGGDWIPLSMPGVIWLSTLVLIASSVTLEMARRSFRNVPTFKKLWDLTTLLGGVFLVGQWMAWQGLAAQGLYFSGNPSSAFFYVLTAFHALHLLGGFVALLTLGRRLRTGGLSRTAVDVTAIYWHFMDGLWIYLLLLLTLWR